MTSGVLVAADSLRTLQADEVETTYFWKKGDSLSSALFSVGIGHGSGGPKLYGKSGWVGRNISYFGDRNWEGQGEGTAIKLIVPKVSPQAKTIAIPIGPSAELAATPEDRKTPVSALETKDEEPETINAPVPPSPEPVTPVKKPLRAAPKPAPLISRTVVLQSCLLGMVGLLLLYSYRYRSERLREEKLKIIAKSFLSWLTLNGRYEAEHISLAETLFAGKLSDQALRGYEVMGYFTKDREHLLIFEQKMKQDNALPPVEFHLYPLQNEYFTKYITLSPEIMCKLMVCSLSPFLQIATLLVLNHLMAIKPELINGELLTKALIDMGKNSPNLLTHANFQKQLLLTLRQLKSFKPSNS